LTQGDRLLVVTEDDLLRAVALVAGLSSGIGIALATGPGPLAPIALDATAVDAALVLFAAVELAEVAKQQPAPSWCAAFALHGLLDRGGITLRPATPTPSLDAALLLREDHASGALTWHAYSQHTLADLLNARLVGLFGERWAPTDPQSRPAMVMASVLPWTHPAGVLYDLLFGLTAAEVMLRDTAAAEAPELLGDLLERAGAGAWLTLTVAVSDGFRAGSDRADDLMASLAGGLIASDSWDRYPPRRYRHDDHAGRGSTATVTVVRASPCTDRQDRITFRRSADLRGMSMSTITLPAQTAPRRPPGPRAEVVELPAVLDCSQVSAAVEGDSPALVELRDGASVHLATSRDGLERILATGAPVYGSTTGFGPHVLYAAAEDPYSHGSGLIAHLASGAGSLLPPPVVRAMMLVRANALAQGHSGVRPQTLAAYLAVLNRGLVPAVPELGSVGASGDLIPLAHVARLLTGEGSALAAGPHAHLLGQTRPAREALASVGLEPTALDARDALSLVNGTSYSTALAALAVVRARRLTERAADLTGWLYASLGARLQALDPRLHAVRRQRGQQRAAALIRTAASASSGGHNPEHPRRSLQEVYSLRCAPQVLGPSLDLVEFAAGLVDDELAGVNDNPVLSPDEDAPAGWVALHGGNFHAAAVATAADTLTGALTQVAVLAERHIDVLASPQTSRGPLLLATRPGAQAGLAGAQLTASAILAEIRHACAWASTMSVPTNAGNQDIVPMAPLAARTALSQADRLTTILAVLAVALGQYQHLVAGGLADGFAAAKPAWLSTVAGFDCDVETHSLIAAARTDLLAADAHAVRL